MLNGNFRLGRTFRIYLRKCLHPFKIPNLPFQLATKNLRLRSSTSIDVTYTDKIREIVNDNLTLNLSEMVIETHFSHITFEIYKPSQESDRRQKKIACKQISLCITKTVSIKLFYIRDL